MFNPCNDVCLVYEVIFLAKPLEVIHADGKGEKFFHEEHLREKPWNGYADFILVCLAAQRQVFKKYIRAVSF